MCNSFPYFCQLAFIVGWRVAGVSIQAPDDGNSRLQLQIQFMALPHLLKYVYTHGSDEVIRRGKKIHAIGFVELVENDYLFGSAVFRVKDDNYSTFLQGLYLQLPRSENPFSSVCLPV